MILKTENYQQLIREKRKGRMVMQTDNSSRTKPLPLVSLNHVSILVRSVWTSVHFYEDVLGFRLIRRPSSFKFHGAWLFNYGIGIHLLEDESIEEYDIIEEERPINPKDNHLSFQCTDVELVKKRLEEKGITYVTTIVEDEGITVDQVFFHDPDGYMIEICNCENIPVLPMVSCPFTPCKDISNYKKRSSYCGPMEAIMMESLSMDMLNFSF